MEHSQVENLHPAIMAHLRKLSECGKLPTSLLFAGRKGIGKWVIAEQVTRELVCLDLPCAAACRCASCRQLERFSHPDVHHLFPLPAAEKEWGESSAVYLHSRRDDPFADSVAGAKQFIPLDSVRRFQTNLSRKASLSRMKVGIVSEAERMLPGTMDSLLKLLEEPPENTHLILITDKPGLLHPTILSRLQRVNFPAFEAEFVRHYLQQNYELGGEQASTLSRLAGGSLNGIAQLVEGDIFESRNVCWQILHDAIRSSAASFAVKHGTSPAVSSREAVEQACHQWQMLLRDCLVLSSGRRDDNLTSQLYYSDLEADYRKLLEAVGDRHRLFHYLEQVELTLQELRRNVNPRMAALNLLTEMSPPQSN